MNEHIVTLSPERVDISRLNGSEWELRLVFEDGRDIIHYTQQPDMIYEQLIEGKFIETNKQ